MAIFGRKRDEGPTAPAAEPATSEPAKSSAQPSDKSLSSKVSAKESAR